MKIRSTSKSSIYDRSEKIMERALTAKQLWRSGAKPGNIAKILGVSRKTVYNYLQSAVDKRMLKEKRTGEKELRSSTGPKITPLNQPLKFFGIPEVNSPVEFCEHEKLLNIKLFPMQKLILKCFYGEKLDDDERGKLSDLEKRGRTTYKGEKKYRELVILAGMKGGKTPLAGMISCWEEYELYKLGLPAKKFGFQPGKKIYIINAAVNADQAQSTIFAEIKGHVLNTDYYRLHRPTDCTETRVEFSNGVVMLAGHSNSSSLVGKVAKLVSFDEIARFVDRGGKYSAESVYYSLIRSIEPFHEHGKILAISSPLFALDFINQLYQKSGEISNMLGFHLPTWEMNPNLPFESEFLQNELKKNPDAFWRDFGARPSFASEAYYKVPDKIDEMFVVSDMPIPFRKDGRLKDFLRGKAGCEYYLHADPSAKNDAFGLALAHCENDLAIVDLAYRFVPTNKEIDINEILYFVLEITKRFRICKFTFDTWQATAIMQALNRRRIPSENLYVDKVVHDRLKEKIYSGKLRVHESEILKKELKELELISGKKVDHSKRGSKDVADAVAGAVWNAVENPQVKAVLVGIDPEERDYNLRYRRSAYAYQRENSEYDRW